MRTKCEEWAGKDDGMIPIAIYKCKIMKCFCICHLPYDSSGTNLMIFDNSLSLSYKECHHDIAWNLDLSIHKRLVKFRQGHNIQTVTNFIRPYLHQFPIDSHGLNGYRKPLKRPYDRYQSRLEVINNGRDIRQINW